MEFPASSPQDALDHCLRVLAREVGAVNATWVGAAREKDWARRNPFDPLLGWRPHICLTLHPTDAWQRAHDVAMDADRNNYMDPQTVALASQFGQNRCFLRDEVVSDRDWKRDRINREVLAPLGIGHRLIGAAATAPGAESYMIFDRESGGRGFSARERDVLRLLLTGVSEREIAAALGLTPATTHQYVVAVLRNFGAHSRAELMSQWLRRLAPSPAPTDQ